MISIVHYIDTNLSRGKREINSSPPSVHVHVQVLTNSEHDDDDYCLSIHSPIESSEFLRNYLLNSFLKSTVKVAFPRVKIKVISDVANPKSLIWSFLSHLQRMIAFPVGSAISTCTINDDISSWVFVDEVCQVIHFSSDYNPT